MLSLPRAGATQHAAISSWQTDLRERAAAAENVQSGADARCTMMPLSPATVLPRESEALDVIVVGKTTVILAGAGLKHLPRGSAVSQTSFHCYNSSC